MNFNQLINNTNKIEIIYPNSLVVNRGNFLSIDKTQIEPKFYYELKKNKFYTLFMVDPDAPSKQNPIYGFWLHWLIGNISLTSNGKIIVPYMGPAPPKNTGPHRYIFILTEQTDKNNYDNMYLLRPKFDLIYFINQFNLKPLAVNYFISENK